MTAPDLLASLATADWGLVGWLALLAGCLALDETAVAQTWLSQPLPAAVLAGLAGGDPGAGLAVGLPLQLALTMNLPVGQTVTGDAAGAAVAVVGAALLTGLAPSLPWQDGDAALTGWLVLGAALLSLAGHPLIQAGRRLHLGWMLEGHRTLRDGRLGRVEAIHVRCLVMDFARGGVFAASAVLVVAVAWLPLYGTLPSGLRPALAWLPWLAAALGLGTVFERYGAARHWRWLVGGLGAGWLLGMLA